MIKVVLINVYFGKLPNYFPLWLKSVEKNPTIDFLIVTDDKTKYNYPKNVIVIYDNFNNIKNRFDCIFDFNNVLDSPYKLCEYKPFYNLIFEDIVKKYDFWGYCDLDLIFGDIRKFLSEDIFNNYKKIYNRGHMTIYKNTKEVNDIISSKELFVDCYNYIEALTTRYVCHFDEGYGVSKIFDYLKINQYNKVDCADINQKKYCFNNLFREDLKEQKGIYKWENGKLFFINEKNKETEIIYAHFQKRNMDLDEEVLEKNVFFAIPNKFICKVDKDISSYCKNRPIYFEYRKRRFKEIITNLKNGSLQEKLYRKIKSKKFKGLKYGK